MAAPDLTIAHGTGTLITAARIRRASDGLDEGSFEAHSASEFTFMEGGAMPGYSGLVIAESENECDGVDAAGNTEWNHSIRAIGLRLGQPRLVSWEAEDSEDGFDTGSEVWQVRDDQKAPYLVYGRAHSKHENLRCVQPREARARAEGYTTITLAFKGIKSGTKPARYRVDTQTREITKENFIVALPGGDSVTPHNWRILLGQPTLQKSYLSLTEPASFLVAQQGVTVDGFPAVNDLSWNNTEVTYNFPNGVFLAGLGYDKIPGTTICFVTEYYTRAPLFAP